MGKHARERAHLAEEPAEQRQGGRKEQGNGVSASWWLEARQHRGTKSLKCQAKGPGLHPGATVAPRRVVGRE